MGRPDLGGSWPIVGRVEQTAEVVDLLTGPSRRTVVLAGPAGVGKSRLVAQAINTVAGDLVVARASATSSASSIPLGALAPLLPVEDLLADNAAGLFPRAAKAIADLGRGTDVVLAVDDAHLLDEASATLVRQLSVDGTVRLLLGVRTGEHMGAALTSVVSAPTTTTIEVRALLRNHVEQLTTQVLGGEIDGAVFQSLWDGSQGNALYLRELLVASVEDSSIECERGVWRLTGRPKVPARLAELIESRLATTSDDERTALEVLAIGGTVGRRALEDLAGTDVVSRLVERGLVIAGRDGRRQPVRLHHPLYEEVLRSRLSARRLRATQLHLADLAEATGMRRRHDSLVVASLKLDAGAELDPELLEAASLDAYFALDTALTERLARAGMAAGAGVRLRRLLAETLRWQGRYEETEAIMSALPLAGVDQRERALSALVRAENLFRGLGQHDKANLVLDEATSKLTDQPWLDEVTAMRALFAALAGDVRSGLADAEAVISNGASRGMLVAATPAVLSLTFNGRPDDAAAIAGEALALASAMEPQEGQAIIARHAMERCLGLVESGRLVESDDIARFSYEWSLAGGVALGQGWFALLLARSAQIAGRVEEAARRYREAALVFRDLRDHGTRRWALAGLAQAAATLGRVGDATIALDELDTAPATAVHLLEAEVLRARAWLAAARSASGEARRHLADSVEWAAARGQHGLELTALHDLVRLGDTGTNATRAAALSGELQGSLAAARGAHAAAARAQDGALLDAAAESFAAIGANLYAAEAAAHAASAHHRAGRPSSAAASEAQRDDLLALCEGAVLPALGRSASGDAAILTARELELATLAAKGLSSADIAAQVGISVRTVNNLLQRSYVKLGISGRRELAAHLDQY